MRRMRSAWLPSLLTALAAVLAAGGAPAGGRPTAQSGAGETPAGFAGSDACAGCHTGYDVLVRRTPHAETPDAVPARGCEGCHGPGEAHIEAVFTGGVEEVRAQIFAFDHSPAENAAMCLNCHRTDAETRHFAGSEHQLLGVDCQGCHAPHPLESAAASMPGPGVAERDFIRGGAAARTDPRWPDDALLRTRQPELCYSCHAVVEAQFSLPTRHRVSEGAMRCTDCHNPHGARSQPMLRSAQGETCVNCHVEKRGPFLYEHAPVRVEGCGSCHEPHGSVNRHLLISREERFLCLQCHVDPFAPNVPHGRLSFATRGDCVRCHATIHGSNNSPFLLD